MPLNDESGIGIKDLTTLNKSLLLRHVHKLFTGVSNPWMDWVWFWYDGGRVEADMPC